MAKLFRGNLNDVTTFPEALGAIREQCDMLEIDPAETTLVVLDSPGLRAGQLRGLDQGLRKPLLALSRLGQGLKTATRRGSRKSIERQINNDLKPPVMRKLFRHELTERKNKPGCRDLDWWIDMEAWRELKDLVYGRRILATDRHDWPASEIARAYWGQSEAEHVFQRMKERMEDPAFLALRPQYHWTDQKTQVHSLMCVVGYLLASLVRREARRMGYTEGLPRLLEMLQEIRMVLRTEVTGSAGRPRIRWQMEEAEPGAMKLYGNLVDRRHDLGPTRPGE